MNTQHDAVEPNVLFLVDGHSQMYRAYHAIRGLTGPDGRSTNAVFGFVAMLRKLIADHRPGLIACAFDLAGPTFRDTLAADYKANRPAMPDDLAEQIPWVHRACEALGVPTVSCEGFEADDVIGTIAARAAAEGYQVVVVTGDKDMFQLVGDRVRVFNPRDEGTWYDADGVKEKFGVAPGQVVDVLALMGDAVDNIKGVPGIGEKGARDLINTYGSLDELLAKAAEVPRKAYREALLAGSDMARQSRQLARLRADAPITFEVETFRHLGPDRAACYALFSELGFRSLTNEFAPTAATTVRDYVLADSAEKVEALALDLRRAGRFALRVVATSGPSVRAQAVGLAFSDGAHRARYVPLRHRAIDSGPQPDPRAALAALAPILQDPAIEKVGHDLKPDLVVLAREGITLRGITFDSMLASYVLDADRPAHAIEGAALEHLGYKALTAEDVCGRGAKAIGFDDLPPDAVLDYASERVDLAIQLAERLAPVVEENGLGPVYRNLEVPLIPVLAELDRAGIRIDAVELRRLSDRLERELAGLSARIFELAGGPFNINSPRQLSEVLFEKLNLPALKRTGKTRVASTAVEVLEELAASHELPAARPRVAQHPEAQGHLHRRAAPAGQRGHGPRAHQLQPGRRRDGPA